MIQGSWSHITASGNSTILVSFTKESSIINMMYRNHILFKEPDMSLLIRILNRRDEGDYHLDFNIEFLNKSGRVFKEEHTVRVTVDGEFT